MIEKGNDNYYLMGTTDHSVSAGGGGIIGASLRRLRHRALRPTPGRISPLTYDGSDAAPVRERHAGLEPGQDRRDHQLHQRAHDRQRPLLRPVLQRPDRQRPHLQHRPHPNPDPNRHDNPRRTAGPDPTPPSAPGTLSATAISATRVDLSWGAATDNIAVTGYHIERCQGAGCSTFAEIGTTTTTSYSDTTTAAGTSYSYRVRANDAVPNLGPYTNTATVTTPSPDLTPPSAPGTLSATAISATRVDLSWGAATDNIAVTGYQIERCQGTGCSSFAQIATTTTATSYSDTTTAASTSYSYRVRANDAVPNFGPYTNTATATTPIQTGPTPVAAYAFDEGSGTTVTDLSGNGNNGTLANTTWATAGKYGGALSFNGTSSRVTVPNSASLQLSTGMTLEAWVNPTTVSSAWRDVIEKGNDNYYLMGTTDHSSVPGGGGTFGDHQRKAFGTSALATNTWTYLATTYDGANLASTSTAHWSRPPPRPARSPAPPTRSRSAATPSTASTSTA